jgi:hypothetical protein
MGPRARRRSLIGLAILLSVTLAACQSDVTGFVLSPADGHMGDFGATTTVSGVLQSSWPDGGVLRINGVETPYAPLASDPNRSWTAEVAVDQSNTVTQITASYTVGYNEYRQILSVVDHVATPDASGAYAPDGVGMRFTNTGLAGLGPVIQNLASSSFDLNALLVGQPVSTPDATGSIYEAGAGNISLVPVSTANGVRATITINDLFVGVNLNVSTLGIGNCRLDVVVPTATIDGYYDLAPAPGNPSQVDVNLLGGTPGATDGQPVVNIPTINYQFTSGACDPDTPLIGGIISSIAGSSVPDAMRSSFVTQLKDPDGTGPLDSPIADAIEQALAGISISGPVGDAVHAHLDSPMRGIAEDAGGMTFRADADFGTVDPVSHLPTCTPPPGAPDIGETASVPSTFPTLGSTTPSGQPYGLGLAISASAFNQMIGAMTECGLLNRTITDFQGQPLTPQLLSSLMPAFAKLIPLGTTGIEIRVRPTAAPYLTGNPGPNGERAELALPNLQLDFMQTSLVDSNGNTIIIPGGAKWLTVAIDTSFGFDLVWDAAAHALEPTLTPPPASAVRARVVWNTIGVDEPSVANLFQALFPSVSAGITDTFAAFPLPTFLGLSLDVLEIGEITNTFVLYANLDAAPTTHVEGFALTDTSTNDFASDDAVSDSNEWRHRIRKTWGSTSGNALFQSSLSADSIVFADEEVGATGGYRTNFTIVPETPGGAWRLELDDSVLGAYTCRAEGLGGGKCQSGFFTSSMSSASPVNASVRVNGGAAQTFNFNPSPQGSSKTGGDFNIQFSGANSKVVTGTGVATIEIAYSFGQRSGSYCGGFLCGGDGHESSLRMGLGDTLSNSFTAGEYPGQGNRVQANDGQRSSWKVCTNTGAACP